MPAVEPDLLVPLDSRSRARRLALAELQHAVPAAVLLFAGIQGLLGEAHGLALSLALFEIAFGALLLRALARETRRAFAAERAANGAGRDAGSPADHRSVPEPGLPPVHAAALASGQHGAHSGPDRTQLLVAGVLLVEALAHRHETGHLPRPTLLLAAVTLGLAFAHAPLTRRAARRRAVVVDRTGVRVSSSRLRGFSARWSDLVEIAVDEREARITARSGRRRRTRRIDLDDLRNAPAVRAALLEAAARLARRAPTSEASRSAR